MSNILLLGAGGPAGAAAPTYAYINNTIVTHTATGEANQSDNALYTFTGCDFGTAHANRVIVCAVYTGGADHDAVSIGGNPATNAVKGVAGTTHGEGIWYLSVPSGASGTIEVTVNGTLATNCLVAWWAIYPSSSAPRSAVTSGTAGGTGNATASPIDVVPGGIVVSLSGWTTSSTGRSTVTYSGTDGINMRLDGDVTLLEGIRPWTVVDIFPIAETNASRSMTMVNDNATSANKYLIAASWGAP